jgi:hypothetical protein
MTKYIDEREAAGLIGVSTPVWRAICRSTENPPPFVRPTPRKMLFETEELLRWQQTTWQHKAQVTR